MYIYEGGPRVPLQNHVADVIKIYQIRSVIIERFVPYFADGLTGPGHSNNHSVCIVLWTTTRKFRNGF